MESHCDSALRVMVERQGVQYRTCQSASDLMSERNNETTTAILDMEHAQSLETENRTVVVVANSAWYLWNFRRALLVAMVELGYSVVCMSPQDPINVPRLRQLGVSFRHWVIEPDSVNPWREWRALCQLKSLMKQSVPSAVFSFTIKANIHVGIIARSHKFKYLPTITGLGTAFLSDRPLHKAGRVLLRRALAYTHKLFVQNADDARIATDLLRVDRSLIVIVPGSGVDLDEFSLEDKRALTPPWSEITFSFVGRFLRQKGVCEYAQAAKRLRAAGFPVKFKAYGDGISRNISAVDIEELEDLSDGSVEFCGWAEDVRDVFKVSDFIVLPSYREGMSRILIEAAASGLPLIASDVPGCRELVDHSINGFLCEPRDVDSLEKVLIQATQLSKEEYIAMMGSSRKKALSFSVQHVNRDYLDALL